MLTPAFHLDHNNGEPMIVFNLHCNFHLLLFLVVVLIGVRKFIFTPPKSNLFSLFILLLGWLSLFRVFSGFENHLM